MGPGSGYRFGHSL